MPTFCPERLRAARKRKGFSQLELAHEAGLSRNTIIAAENGASAPHGGTLRRLAVALDITVESLFSDGDA